MDIKRAQELVDEFENGLLDRDLYTDFETMIDIYQEFIQAIADNNIDGDIELIARKILEI